MRNTRTHTQSDSRDSSSGFAIVHMKNGDTKEYHLKARHFRAILGSLDLLDADEIVIYASADRYLAGDSPQLKIKPSLPKERTTYERFFDDRKDGTLDG